VHLPVCIIEEKIGQIGRAVRHCGNPLTLFGDSLLAVNLHEPSTRYCQSKSRRRAHRSTAASQIVLFSATKEKGLEPGSKLILPKENAQR
jgi:hypothetical protein